MASAPVGTAFCPEAGWRTDQLLAAKDRLAVQQLARPQFPANRAGPRLRIEHGIRLQRLGRQFTLGWCRQDGRAAHRKFFSPLSACGVFKTGFDIHSALQMVIYFTLYTFLSRNVPVRNKTTSDAVQSTRFILRQPIRPWVVSESRTTKRAAWFSGNLKSNSTWLPWCTAHRTAPAAASSRRTDPSIA